MFFLCRVYKNLVDIEHAVTDNEILFIFEGGS